MGNASKVVLTVAALSLLTPLAMVGQAPAGLSITDYQFVSEERLTRTESNLTYRAELLNNGGARTAVTATLSSSIPNVQLVSGRGVLRFLQVPANSQVPTNDTFTIKVDRTVAFDFAALKWAFTVAAGPIANAGPSQTVAVGGTATLNGSGSTNPSGVGALTYSWAFASRPNGSSAQLKNPTSVSPSFVVDTAGAYVVTLTVSNGTVTDTDTVTIDTLNSPPVAKAGSNQTVSVGATVTLNGSGSSDVDGDALTYAWTLSSRPAGSTAALSSATAVSPTFHVDKAGTYVAQLVVSDGKAKSPVSMVSITTQNTPPVANAGAGQTVDVGDVVHLSGASSTDVDGDPLTYHWTLLTVPAASSAVLNSASVVNPTFTADRPGTYVTQLVVNDGHVNSSPITVAVTTNEVQAPTANAGPNQTVKHGATVTLNGSGTDPQSLPLTLHWSLTTKPAGSTVVLSSTTAAKPTFVADRPGTFVAQLVVSNGVLNSAPDTVSITTTNTAPVSKAGPAQNVIAGSLVSLSGGTSSDADGDPLTFSWSFTTRPAGSTAALSAASSPTPTFVSDIPGVYVAQLIVSDAFTASTPTTVTITAVGVLTITTSALPDGTVGVAYSQTIAAIGGKTPYTFSLASGSLPAGLTLNASSGAISGKPTTAVTKTPLTIKVTDSSSPARTDTANLTLTILAPSPASISATAGTPQSAAINTQFSAPLVATVKDASGHPVSGVTVTFTAPPTGASGNFTGAATAVTNASGVATSSAFKANPVAGSYNVVATVAGVATGATFSLKNTPGPPATIRATSGTPQNIAINTVFGAALVATVEDSGGNPVSGVTVTFTAPASGASGAFTGAATAVTNTSGIATSSVFKANATAGSYTVKASVAGVATSAAFSLKNNPGPAASIIITSGSSQSAAINANFAAPLVATVKDAGGNAVSGVTVTFTAPASGASGAFAGGATAVTNASGVATSHVFKANAKAGSYTVNASIAGVATPAAFALKNTPGAPATITATSGTPQTATINANFAAPFVATVKDAGGNPVSGVTVAFTAPSSGASGTFAGAATAVTNASGVATSTIFKANSTAGTYNVVASTSGVATSAAFSLKNNPGPAASIVTTSGAPQSVPVNTPFGAPLVATVRDAGGNAVSGVTVTFAAPASGASAVFSGATTAVTNASGAATSSGLKANGSAGTYSIKASVAGIATPAAFSLTNTPVGGGGGVVKLSNATVGKGLQTALTLTLPEPAPAGGLPVTLSVNNTSLVKVSGRSAETGSGSIQFTIGEGQTTVIGIYVQGQAISGTATATAVTSLGNATSTITLAPSGFVLAGPNGPGVPSFTSPQGLNTTITVVPARLTASLTFAEVQQVSGGSLVAVAIDNSTSTVGSVTPNSVTLNGGDSGANVTFKALLTGSTTLTALVPLGFSTPAVGVNSLAASVTPAGLSADPVTVGQNLETTAAIALGGAAPSAGLKLTITSNDDTKVLLSATPDGAGVHSLTMDIQGGRTVSPEFYVYGRASSGTGSYSATASGFGSATGTVNLRPSGFLLSGPFGLGADFLTTTGAGNSDLTVFSYMLDASRNPLARQAVQGGITARVPVISEKTSVGTITTSPVVITGPGSEGVTQFNPIADGDSLISLSTPAGGFSMPTQSVKLTARVTQPAINFNGASAIGQNLQSAGTLVLGQPAPSGGLTVTLTSNPAQLRFSLSPTTAGSTAGTFTVNVPAGQSSAIVYVQGRDDTGTAIFTASAPGYKSKITSIVLTPSAVLIESIQGPGAQITSKVGSVSQPVFVSTWLLDPATNEPFEPQSLAGGVSISVALINSAPAIGTVTTPITIAGGADNGSGQFKPLAAGQTTIKVTQPAGFANPTSNGSLVAKVNP